MRSKRKGQVSKSHPVSFYKIASVCLLYVLLCMRFLISFVPSNQPGSRLEELSDLKKRLEEAILEKQNLGINASRLAHPARFKRAIIFQSKFNLSEVQTNHTCNMHIYLDERASFCEQCERYPNIYTTFNEMRNYNNCNIQHVSNNCYSLQRSYLFGKDNVTNEETRFPLAFAMKVHTHPNQAHRLLRMIYRSHNLYCIHVDKEAPALIFEYFKRIAGCLDNVILINDNLSVVYSTIRQIEAEFKCVDASLSFAHKWKYYITLNGLEFPLRTNLELVRILKLLNGSNLIESYSTSTDKHKKQIRTKIFNKFASISKERKVLLSNITTLYKGSAYIMVTRQFFNFTLNDVQTKDVFNWLKDAYVPEEMYWTSLITFSNGYYKKGVNAIKKTFISRAVNGQQNTSDSSFVFYGVLDLGWLYSHGNILANKFAEDYQPLALDCLERELYKRTMSKSGIGVHFNISKYNDLRLSHSDNY